MWVCSVFFAVMRAQGTWAHTQTQRVWSQEAEPVFCSVSCPVVCAQNLDTHTVFVPRRQNMDFVLCPSLSCMLRITQRHTHRRTHTVVTGGRTWVLFCVLLCHECSGSGPC